MILSNDFDLLNYSKDVYLISWSSYITGLQQEQKLTISEVWIDKQIYLSKLDWKKGKLLHDMFIAW